MGRKILAVIVGYAAMVAVTLVAFSLAFSVLGVDHVYRAGSYDASAVWLTIAIVLGLFAGIGGGWLCKLVGRNGGAVKALAVAVILVGLVSAFFQLNQERPDVARPDTVSMTDAMQNSRQPAWFAILVPFVGAAGVMFGGRLRA